MIATHAVTEAGIDQVHTVDDERYHETVPAGLDGGIQRMLGLMRSVQVTARRLLNLKALGLRLSMDAPDKVDLGELLGRDVNRNPDRIVPGPLPKIVLAACLLKNPGSYRNDEP